MPAGASSFHKKLVFGSAGCALLLVVLMVLGWLGAKQMGFETPQRQRVIPPAAAAALDSLSRMDLSRWVEEPISTESLRCHRTDRTRHVAPRTATDSLSLPIGFGDTFPPDSPRRRLWMRFGSVVVLDRGAPVGAAYLDSLPPGRWLLAGVRVQLEQGNRSAACVMLAAALDKAGRLESHPDLRSLVARVELERDAAVMVARDSQLRAASEIGQALPLPVREAFVRAIGYGWIDDPREMSFGVDRARRNAIDRLLHEDVPETLRRTAQAANEIMQASLVQRFQFAVAYRTQRLLAP